MLYGINATFDTNFISNETVSGTRLRRRLQSASHASSGLDRRVRADLAELSHSPACDLTSGDFAERPIYV